MRSQILAVQKMQDYIETHLTEDITLAALADICSFSSLRLINWSNSLYSLLEEVSYSAGSILPYQNSSKMFITSPSLKSVCDVNSGDHKIQEAKIPRILICLLVILIVF